MSYAPIPTALIPPDRNISEVQIIYDRVKSDTELRKKYNQWFMISPRLDLTVLGYPSNTIGMTVYYWYYEVYCTNIKKYGYTTANTLADL